MSEDHNRWIVSSHAFLEHTSIVDAEREFKRLSGMFPKRKFRVYRIKRVVDPEKPQQRGSDE